MKLFIYDHCPYCVKARIIFGLKNIDFDLVTLLNDDEDTPISMIGEKMVPILQKDDGSFMGESLDIIDYIDDNYADQRCVEMDSDENIIEWISVASDYLYQLCMPRWVQADLEEFQAQGAIDYFVYKKEAYIGDFEDNLDSSEELIELANRSLVRLDGLLKNRSYPQGGRITFDDIHLFAVLRSLSIVSGIKYPKHVEYYRQKMSEISKINLHDDIAL